MVGLLLSPFCTVFLSPLVYNPTCLLKWLKKPGICPKKPGKFSLITCCGPGIFHGAFIVIFTSGNDGAFTVAAGWLVDDDGLIHARMNRWMDDDGSGGGNTIGAAFLGAVAGRSTVPLDVSGYGLRRLWLEWNRRRTIRARVAMGARPYPRSAGCGTGRYSSHWVSPAVQVKIWGMLVYPHISCPTNSSSQLSPHPNLSDTNRLRVPPRSDGDTTSLTPPAADAARCRTTSKRRPALPADTPARR